MPYIKKLVLKGFKSFPKETPIEFSNSMNVIVGPNGSGKCLAGDSLVQLGDGTSQRIDSIVDKRLNRAVKTEDGFLISGDGTEVMCLDMNSLKTIRKPVKSFVKRTSPEKLLKIKTCSGREITATKYHPLFSLKNSEIKALRADELKKGVRIAIPRKIEYNPENKFFIELLDNIKINDKIYIPYREEYGLILKSIKDNLTWEQLAKKINVPYYSIKGLLDKQSTNFFNIIKILRAANLSDIDIIKLTGEFTSKGKITKFSFINSGEFSRFFGYLLAEGRLSNSSQIWFTNGDKEIVKDYIYLVKKLFGMNPLVREYKPNCWDVIIFSEALKKILNKLGMASKTENKQISDILLKHSSDKEISELLNGLYCGDSYVSDSSIEITTKSKKLAKGIENCLLRLGIIYHKKEVTKGCGDFLGKYVNIIIYGVDNFKAFNKHITLKHLKKNERILGNLGKKSNPNLDLIEVNNLVKKITNELSINVKKTRKQFPVLDSYCYQQCLPSRTGLKTLIENLFIKDLELVKKLKLLVESDIYWDQITEIEEISGEEWVYDLCVERDHNFIANNIFVHNSNITDAICFVLGRMSIKSLRAKKAGNLIFLGTKQYKPASEASVKIIFDNADKHFSLPNKEIIIERAVRRSGQSRYRINDKTKTRQEVLELLGQAGIDPYGFNIMLQGEIDSIVKMSGEDRRKIIEEVAGISIYELRKEKSLRELEKTEERLKEVLAILKERIAYLRNLEEERNQALKYKKLEQDIKKDKASIIKRKIKDKEKELEKINRQVEEKDEEKEKFRKESQEKENRISELEEEIKKINFQIQKSSGIQQESLNREISDLRAELAGLEVRKESSQEKIEENFSRKERIEKEIKNLQEEIKNLREEFPNEKRKQKELEKKKLELEKIEKEREKLYGLKEKLSAIKERIKDKEKDTEKTKNQISFILKEVDKISKDLIYSETETCNKKLTELKAGRGEAEKNLEKLQQELGRSERNVSSLKTEISNLERIKGQVSELDICPLCKSKITEEHIKKIFKECNEKISSLNKELQKSQELIENSNKQIKSTNLKLSSLQENISKAEISLIKLQNIEEKKEQIKTLSQEEKDLEKETTSFRKEKISLEKNLPDFRGVEERYDKIILEIQEISSRTEENIDAELELKQRSLENLKLTIKQFGREEQELKEEVKELEGEIETKEEKLTEREEENRRLEFKNRKLIEKRNLFEREIHKNKSSLLEIQNKISNVNAEINNLKVNVAEIKAKKESLEIDFEPYKGTEIISLPIYVLEERLEKNQRALDSLGTINLRALEVYDKIKKDYDAIAEKVDVLEKEKQEILKIIEEIDRKKKKTLIRTLNAVNELFSRNFSQLYLKGSAFLDLENKEDPFTGGLDIIIRIGKGKYFDVNSLSGGEKTLVALSLIFAIQEYKPYAFYIFDEVDATLDKRNSERLATLVKKYMKTGQYIIITHNDAIISESTLLYGVSMQEGLSKILSLEV